MSILQALRARSRARRDDAGFTMAEQIVVLGVLGLVLVMAFAFLTSATTITARADAHVRAEQDAGNALRTATQDLRGAATVSQSGCTGLTYDKCVTVEISKVTAGTASCPKRVVTYKVVNSELRQLLTDYAANCTTVTRSWDRPLVSGVQSTSIFTYYNTDGVTPLNLSSNTDLAKVPTTPAIKVALSVKYRNNADAISFSSIAALRNNR